MNSAVAALTSVESWFNEFVRQSANSEKLGSLQWFAELQGGLSGAGVAVGLCAIGPFVLKWGPLESILEEATARRELADQDARKQGPALDTLRQSGASHVAIRFLPKRPRKKEPPEAFGIVMSTYEGTMAPENKEYISDFRELLQDLYPDQTRITDEQLRIYLTKLADTLTPDVNRPKTKQQTSTLPDIAQVPSKPDSGLVGRLAAATGVLQQRGHDPASLGNLAAWINERLGYDVPRVARDERFVHGDPRFANLVVDRGDNKVALIDFGEGHLGHVFSDFARFEGDILTRTTAAKTGSDRIAEIQAGVRQLQASQRPPLQPGRSPLTVAALWREERDRSFPALHEAKPLNLYSLFMIKELLGRIRWWSKPERTLDEVGATVPELVAAINFVRETVEERDGRPVQRLWVTANESALIAVLKSWGVNQTEWGGNATKTAVKLLAELQRGDCDLVVDANGLARRVRNIWIDVHVNLESGRRHLVEREQVNPDGSPFRTRNLPSSLGEKCKIDEDPAVAAQRGLAEELGIEKPLSLVQAESRENPVGEPSYPGLRTVYDTYWFIAEIDPKDYKPEGYVEEQPDKRTYFEWEGPSASNSALDGLA